MTARPRSAAHATRLVGGALPAERIAQLVLAAYVIAVFALGGGARDDISSLAILRPLSIAVLGYALVIADREVLRANRMLIGLATAWTGLVALHLVPLPPFLWQALPGRELAVAIDEAAGLGPVWRPLSLVPHRTLNALLSLSVPLAPLVLALAIPRSQLRFTLPLLVVLAFLSALVSLLQVAGGGSGAFYFYRITNDGSAVGLFANRNHNAIALALAIAGLGALRSQLMVPRELARHRPLITTVLALTLVPFLVLTQSRAGLALGLVALIAHVALASGRIAIRPSPRLVLAGVMVIALAVTSWLLAGESAIARLASGADAAIEMRFAIWPTSFRLALDHFPAGSGIGTFVEVYRAGEPASTLGATYINHAHNDFLEIALTGGLPALALLTAGAAWLACTARRALAAARGAERVMRSYGVVVLAIFALASLYDYPLRTPSLAVHFILALVWIAGRESRDTSRTRSHWRPKTSAVSDAASGPCPDREAARNISAPGAR
ncbi:O-antigen ligase family protein [Qipengyuania nanhaisediminis]|uniref:O-antigen ligase family protein n=1 Tax=Qipengyuania nanhaisediminis TaxID=604088 RepID=UPI0038B2B04F